MYKDKSEFSLLNKLIQSLPDAAIVTNKNGRIILFNALTEQLFGYPYSELIEKPIDTLLAQCSKEIHGKQIKNLTNRPVENTKSDMDGVPVLHKSGREFSADIRFNSFESDGAQFVILTIRDVTAYFQKMRALEQTNTQVEGKLQEIDKEKEYRAEIEKALKAQQTELAQMARADALGEIVTSISHEINQPLAAITNYARGCVNYIKSGSGDNEDIIKALEECCRQAEKAARIMTRIRNFVRKKDITLETTTLNTVIMDALTLIDFDLAAKGVGVELNLGSDLPDVSVDTLQIQQVLVNLIRNAVDAMLEKPKEGRKLEIYSKMLDSEEVECGVDDSGSGIKPDDGEKIFTPFFTTKENGMGVGLSISQSIMHAHSGTLNYKKGSHGGTLFYFRLPVQKAR
ncbi:MAG: ATP-binding protein [Gammaproteobacteria bacterium]|nr:ATP-binding protein [Gammaproteobacteria bacterium]MDH5693101.1 ATP-binding protein [Gammaproteobacteria bacterium]